MRHSPIGPRRMVEIAGLSVLSLLPAIPAASGPATLPSGFTDTLLAGALERPVALAVVPESAPQPRLLFAEQTTGRVGLIGGSGVVTVGTVPDVETNGNERGLLGIAVDPDFPARPFLYAHSTDSRGGGQIAVTRFTLTGDLDFSASGDLAFAAASRYDVLVGLPDDASIHNGGTVCFGPDGMLYVSVGDDNGGCDAQDIAVPAGKVLRLDVSGLPGGPGGPASLTLITPADNPFVGNADPHARLVWVYGLRNPFRFHIDGGTGALFVADVGESQWEELSRFAAGGLNGGWPWFEGPDSFSPCSGSLPEMVDPIAAYDHSDGSAIISGGVYRGPTGSTVRFPSGYDGDAFYLDYYTGFMRRLVGSGTDWSPAAPVEGQPNPDDWGTGFDNVSDVRMLPDGSMVYVRQSVNFAAGTGEVRKIQYLQTTDVRLAAAAPRVSLAPPRPSPSRGRVTFAWSQPAAARVRLAVLDLGGRIVRVLEDGMRMPAGSHERVWDGRGAGGAGVLPGIYFVTLEVAGHGRASARVARMR